MAAAPRVIRFSSRGLSSLIRGRQPLTAPAINLLCTHSRSLQAGVTQYWKYPVNSTSIRWYGDSAPAMTEAELSNRVVNVVKMFDKVTPDKVTIDAHFVKDLGLDSLDAVEIVMAFEDEFAVEISDEEAEKILSCQDAVNLLKVKMDISS